MVQSNNDASQQQIYRGNDNSGALLAGAAAAGGLLWLLSKGKGGGKSVAKQTDDAIKMAPTMQLPAPASVADDVTKAGSTSNVIYPNGQQGAVDELVKRTQATTDETVGAMKEQAELVRRAKANDNVIDAEFTEVPSKEELQAQINKSRQTEGIPQERNLEQEIAAQQKESYDRVKNMSTEERIKDLGLTEKQMQDFENSFNKYADYQKGKGDKNTYDFNQMMDYMVNPEYSGYGRGMLTTIGGVSKDYEVVSDVAAALSRQQSGFYPNFNADFNNSIWRKEFQPYEQMRDSYTNIFGKDPREMSKKQLKQARQKIKQEDGIGGVETFNQFLQGFGNNTAPTIQSTKL